MNGPDFAGVLDQHQPEDITAHYCACSDYRLDEPWTAHVAAALDAEVVAAQAEAWDEGYEVHKPRPDTNPTTNPYRAALAALAQAGGGDGE